MPSPIDVARNMLPAVWRSVPFECGPWEFGFDQGHAAHLYPDRDAGFIESTGRNPATYGFTAYFRNGIGGQKDILFPTRWQKFVAACADRSVGTLTQPALGDLKVKCQRCVTHFDPEKRDGVDVQVSFIETTDADDELAKLLGQTSPMAVAISSAGDLDGEVADISPSPLPYPDALSPSALESLKALSGAVSQFKRGIGNIGAAIDSTLGALDEFSHTLDKFNAKDPNIAKALRSINRCFDAVLSVATSTTSQGKQITQAIVQNESTLDAVASFFAMSADDFARLNPRAAVAPKLPRGTRVFVFA